MDRLVRRQQLRQPGRHVRLRATGSCDPARRRARALDPGARRRRGRGERPRACPSSLTMHDFWWCCARGSSSPTAASRRCSLVVDCGVCQCEVDHRWLGLRNARLRAACCEHVDVVLCPSAVGRGSDGGKRCRPREVPRRRERAGVVTLTFRYTGGWNEMKGVRVLDRGRACASRPATGTSLPTTSTTSSWPTTSRSPVCRSRACRASLRRRRRRVGEHRRVTGAEHHPRVALAGDARGLHRRRARDLHRHARSRRGRGARRERSGRSGGRRRGARRRHAHGSSSDPALVADHARRLPRHPRPLHRRPGRRPRSPSTPSL